MTGPAPSADAVKMILTQIGYVFLQIQRAEKTVKLAVLVVMPAAADLFAPLIERLEPKKRKPPLGPFLNKLRSRATVHPDIEQLLARYLDNRNRFVHNLSEVEGWSLTTHAGCVAASRFLNGLLDDAQEVRAIFRAMLHAYQLQTNMPTTEEDGREFDELVSKYGAPLIARNWGNGD